jgi:hypothetical protein
MFSELFDKLRGKTPAGAVVDLEQGEIVPDKADKKAAEQTDTPKEPQPMKYKKTLSVRYYSIINNFGSIPIEKLQQDKSGELDEVYYAYHAGERFAALLLFRPLYDLLTLKGGELQKLELDDEIGKVSYAFFDLQELTAAIAGDTHRVYNILRECIASCGDLSITPLYDHTEILDLDKVTKVEISVGKSEALLNDQKYRDMFEPLGFWDAESGTITIQGGFDPLKIKNMITYFLSYDQQAKPFKKIIVTGKVDKKTRIINILVPKATGKVTYQTTEEYLCEKVKLLKLAAVVFACMDNDISARPVKYTRDIEDFLEDE